MKTILSSLLFLLPFATTYASSNKPICKWADTESAIEATSMPACAATKDLLFYRGLADCEAGSDEMVISYQTHESCVFSNAKAPNFEECQTDRPVTAALRSLASETPQAKGPTFTIEGMHCKWANTPAVTKQKYCNGLVNAKGTLACEAPDAPTFTLNSSCLIKDISLKGAADACARQTLSADWKSVRTPASATDTETDTDNELETEAE